MANNAPNLGFKKVALAPCTEPHGSDKTHTATACTFCNLRVCTMHQQAHIVGHFQSLHAAMEQIAQEGDDRARALAQAALAPKKG